MGKVCVLLLAACFAGVVRAQDLTQDSLDHFARFLNIKLEVISNLKIPSKSKVEVTLSNSGSRILKTGNWAIYFDSRRMLEPDAMNERQTSVTLTVQGIKLSHWQGSHFKMEPTNTFHDLPPGRSRKVKFVTKYWNVARTDIFPNWYMASPGLNARVLESTRSESLPFVHPFDKVEQFKRYKDDRYNPFTAQERYGHFQRADSHGDELRVIPKPLKMAHLSNSGVEITSTWKIFSEGHLQNEAEYLSDKTKLNITSTDIPNYVIRLKTGTVPIVEADVIANSPDVYSLAVELASNRIEIMGHNASGVFYGIQTLLSLWSDNGLVPDVTIKDAPRFEYRALRLDSGRNFIPKHQVFKMLDAMATYKLNRLLFHLSDDEGWRLEIPGLPELTQVGSSRCFDPSEMKCLLPQLGSGPDNSTFGSGYYTVTDYKEILQYAKYLHIEVVPELDMPGHARAAVVAMKERARKFRESNQEAEATKYLLTDENDSSKYLSAQMFRDNVMNPCLESSYNFISHVLDQLIDLHKDIQPLKIAPAVGDDIPDAAWVNSTSCQTLGRDDPMAAEDLTLYFFRRLSNLTASKGLAQDAWDEVSRKDETSAHPPSSFPNQNMIAYSCDSTYSYILANSGYKVVLCSPTHLHFDHPYEPDPEERGMYWATRYTDTKKAFSFMPENIYANLERTVSGEVTSKLEVCGRNVKRCPPLVQKENVLGMEARLYGELLRSEEQMHYMVFPRLLALAERAWHKAKWESMQDRKTREAAMIVDWSSFARAVGIRELPRLNVMGINYRIAPPGGKVENTILKTDVSFPGLIPEFSTDGGKTWQIPTGNNVIRTDTPIKLRTKDRSATRFSREIFLHPAPPPPVVGQEVIDYIAENIALTFAVLDNYKYDVSGFLAQITLRNIGKMAVGYGNWIIYFNSIYMIEYDHLPNPNGYVLEEYKLRFHHVKGSLFLMEPVYGFKTLAPGAERKINLKIQNWMVSRTDTMPNWYVTSAGMTPKTIKTTADESLSFVADFNTPNQWKRYNTEAFQDRYDPYTPEFRFTRNSDIEDLGQTQAPVIPTPVKYTQDYSKTVSMATCCWTIVVDPELERAAKYFKYLLPSLGLPNATTSSTKPSERYVHFKRGNPEVRVNQSIVSTGEAYSLAVNPDSQGIEIIAQESSGAFYAVQTLRMLLLKDSVRGRLPQLAVKDSPRYEYRGMHLDVGRNFHSKNSVLKLLDAMALYKLNILHFHLTEDEGWRVQIPGLPELTDIGSQRCHDLAETTCVTPQLGSGPDNTTSGSGYYKAKEYQEILEYAADRHIEVIPEVDMPGHAHAAIKAMEARRQHYLDIGDIKKADEFLLSDIGDPSKYLSTQMFDDNSVNPCITSTYVFIQHVVQELIKLHANINPLKTYHFGGDEVARGAWVNSTACSALLRNGTFLKEHFTQHVSSLTSARGLNMAGWEDGLMETPSKPFRRDLLQNKEVYGYAWDNVWEWGASDRTHRLANAGYKVVIAPVTHFYFDHPYEPDPEERGFYWGPRYTDTKKTFSFMPDHLYNNVEVSRAGDPLTVEDVCGKDGSKCEALKKPENIAGVQGHLWSETVRTTEEMEYMIFPRLMALAERGWHRASWEDIKEKQLRDVGRIEDWQRFANTMGYADFKVLDKLNISFRLPPPGARLRGNVLYANSPFPGLETVVSFNGGKDVTPVGSDGIQVIDGQRVHLYTRSPNGRRLSRATSLTVRVAVSRACLASFSLTVLALTLLVSYLSSFV